MQANQNTNPLSPLLERLYTEVHWIRRPGEPPSCIRRPLRAVDIKRHLNCVGPAVGAVPIAPGESTTRVALLDLDSHKGETGWAEMVDTALVIVDQLESASLRANAFRSSGGAGIHLVCLWERPQDARSVRALLTACLAGAGLTVGTAGVAAGQCEVFPKQSSVGLDALGSMFILPLAGESIPLDPLELEPLPKDDFSWRLSDDVPLLPPEPERESAPAPTIDLDLLRSAAAAIPNSGADELASYDAWFRLICAIHAGSGGSEEGLEIAHALSRRSAKYDERFLDERVWPYIKDREDGITAQTLLMEARRHGWAGDVLAEFEDLGPDTRIALPAGEPPALAFGTDDAGRAYATIENVHTALSRPDWCGIRVAHDVFQDELMWASRDADDWRLFTDTDYTRLRLMLEQRDFKPISGDMIRDVVRLLASENKFDSAQLWLRTQVPAWDGKPRIETFYPTYLRTVDTPYARAIGKYMWTAMAGRVLHPGCKADMVPIWVSKQGTRKTTSVEALVGCPEHFVELRFDAADDTFARMIRGRLVGEANELRGLHTKDLEGIKSLVTRTHEKWIPKYREFACSYPRRIIMIGTTNEEEFLADETGNRRWLPIRIGEADLAAIQRDRLQLWAEARDAFKSTGIGWQGVVELATEAHDTHRMRDSWEDYVLPYINGIDPDDPVGQKRRTTGVTTTSVLTEALAHDAPKIGRAQEMRVAKILKWAGLTNQRARKDGSQFRLWRDEG
jgi:hypothetical protein